MHVVYVALHDGHTSTTRSSRAQLSQRAPPPPSQIQFSLAVPVSLNLGVIATVLADVQARIFCYGGHSKNMVGGITTFLKTKGGSSP
jgi:hypothetical protein